MLNTAHEYKRTLSGFALTGLLFSIMTQSAFARPKPLGEEAEHAGGPRMACHARFEEHLPDGYPGMLGGGRPPAFLRGLELTEDQQDQVFRLMHTQALEMRDRGKAIHKAHEALRELANSDDYDEAKARALADTLSERMAEMTLLVASTEHRIYQLLTVEQRKGLEKRSSDARPD